MDVGRENNKTDCVLILEKLDEKEKEENEIADRERNNIAEQSRQVERKEQEERTERERIEQEKKRKEVEERAERETKEMKEIERKLEEERNLIKSNEIINTLNLQLQKLQSENVNLISIDLFYLSHFLCDIFRIL